MRIQGTFGVIQGTFGVIQGTFSVIQGTFSVTEEADVVGLLRKDTIRSFSLTGTFKKPERTSQNPSYFY